MEFYDSYELVGGPLCGLEVVLGRIPDGSNLFMRVPAGCYPDQVIFQTQYCFDLAELKLFFVVEICIGKALRRW